MIVILQMLREQLKLGDEDAFRCDAEVFYNRIPRSMTMPLGTGKVGVEWVISRHPPASITELYSTCSQLAVRMGPLLYQLDPKQRVPGGPL